MNQEKKQQIIEVIQKANKDILNLNEELGWY